MDLYLLTTYEFISKSYLFVTSEFIMKSYLFVTLEFISESYLFVTQEFFINSFFNQELIIFCQVIGLYDFKINLLFNLLGQEQTSDTNRSPFSLSLWQMIHLTYQQFTSQIGLGQAKSTASRQCFSSIIYIVYLIVYRILISYILFVPQGFDWVQLGCLVGWVVAEEDSYQHGEAHCHCNRSQRRKGLEL